jgi:hypothetical protein
LANFDNIILRAECDVVGDLAGLNLRLTASLTAVLKFPISMPAPYPDRTILNLVCHNDDAVMLKTWEEVIKVLDELYPGKAWVAVIQESTMQYLLPAT